MRGYSIGVRRTFDTDKKNIGTNHLYNYMANVISSIRPKIFYSKTFLVYCPLSGPKQAQMGKYGKMFKIAFKVLMAIV